MGVGFLWNWEGRRSLGEGFHDLTFLVVLYLGGGFKYFLFSPLFGRFPF